MPRSPLVALALFLVIGVTAMSAAQAVSARGLVVDVDHARRVVVLQTRGGRLDVPIPAGASIQDHHARPITFAEIRAGDALAYHVTPDGRGAVTVASHFWGPTGD